MSKQRKTSRASTGLGVLFLIASLGLLVWALTAFMSLFWALGLAAVELILVLILRLRERGGTYTLALFVFGFTLLLTVAARTEAVMKIVGLTSDDIVTLGDYSIKAPAFVVLSGGIIGILLFTGALFAWMKGSNV